MNVVLRRATATVTAPLAVAILLVLAAGAAASLRLLPRSVRIDGKSDWRGVSQGLRRSAYPGTLAASPRALVHFHGVRGGIAGIEVLLSSARADETVAVEVEPGESAPFRLAVGARPLRVALPAPSGGPIAADVWLLTQVAESGGGRVLVHEVVLRRSSREWLVRILPGLGGLAVLLSLWRRREPVGWAAAWALATVVGLSLAVCAALDPVALLPLAPATRASLQRLAVAALCTAAAARAGNRAVTALAIPAVAVALYAPTLRYGLVYDDFLWTRPWSLGEIAAVFTGSEDPAGVSNSYYRPIASLTHALEYAAWGLRPAVYHATNVALFGAVALMAWTLLGRLGLARSAAAAGALAFVLHPMGAYAVAWISQRTDSLLALSYLGALRVLVSERFGRAHAAGAIALGVLALATKELAVTLPIAATLVLRGLPSPADRPRRWIAVRVLALLVVAYLALWAAMFPDKLLHRAGPGSGWGGFDIGWPGDWLRLLPELYGPVVAPTGYEAWWRTAFGAWPWTYLAGVTAGVLALAWVGRGGDGPARSSIVLGLAWPLVAIGPLLGLRGLDLYRGGLLISFAAALIVAGLVHRLEDGGTALRLAGLAALAFWLVPLATDAAAAWGPGGFYRTMTQSANRKMVGWLAALRPENREYFRAQVALEDHMRDASN